LDRRRALSDVFRGASDLPQCRCSSYLPVRDLNVTRTVSRSIEFHMSGMESSLKQCRYRKRPSASSYVKSSSPLAIGDPKIRPSQRQNLGSWHFPSVQCNGEKRHFGKCTTVSQGKASSAVASMSDQWHISANAHNRHLRFNHFRIWVACFRQMFGTVCYRTARSAQKTEPRIGLRHPFFRCGRQQGTWHGAPTKTSIPDPVGRGAVGDLCGGGGTILAVPGRCDLRKSPLRSRSDRLS
jgi:hypothetical protein